MRKITGMHRSSTSARLTAILTAAALAAGMTGCAGASQDAAETAQTQSGWSSVADTQEQAASGSTEAAAQAAEGASAGAAYTEDASDAYTALYSVNEHTALQTQISTEDSDYDTGSSDSTCSLKLQGLQVTDAGYDALNAALQADTEEADALQQESAAGMFMDMGDDSASETSEESEEAAAAEYALETTVILKRADAKLVSYLRCDYSQFGGAHPMTSFNGRNYDAQTGEALSLNDVTTDYDGLYQYVLAELQQRQQNSDETGAMYFDDYETTVGQYFYGANGVPSADSQESESYSSVNWYLTDDALTVIFDIYSIAPYAAGASIVSVPVSSGLLNNQYFG